MAWLRMQATALRKGYSLARVFQQTDLPVVMPRLQRYAGSIPVVSTRLNKLYGCSSVDQSVTLRRSRSEVQVLPVVPTTRRSSNGKTRDFDSRNGGSSPPRRSS